MKLALLFLVMGNIYHEFHWQRFLEGNQKNYTVYVHSKNGLAEDSFFKKYELPYTIPTTWANTMKAQIALLKEAVKNQKNEKFVFLSESTLPIKSFKKVHSTIMKHNKSMFFYEPNPHQYPQDNLYSKRSMKDIAPQFRYKCSQWVVLNRKHAEKMVADEYYLDRITKYEADNELYPGSFIASQEALSEVDPIDTTYVNWEKHNPPGSEHITPYIFTDLSKKDEFSCIIRAILKNYLFARKFSSNANLTPINRFLPYMQKK